MKHKHVTFCNEVSFEPRTHILRSPWSALENRVTIECIYLKSEIFPLLVKLRMPSWKIHQFWYIKIQPKTIDLNTRLWVINPTNSVFVPQSLVIRSIVLGWVLIYRNWPIMCLNRVPVVLFLVAFIGFLTNQNQSACYSFAEKGAKTRDTREEITGKCITYAHVSLHDSTIRTGVIMSLRQCRRIRTRWI